MKYLLTNKMIYDTIDNQKRVDNRFIGNRKNHTKQTYSDIRNFNPER